jgi:hypothetical protein
MIQDVKPASEKKARRNPLFQQWNMGDISAEIDATEQHLKAAA